jgi:predicted amino acid racemase
VEASRGVNTTTGTPLPPLRGATVIVDLQAVEENARTLVQSLPRINVIAVTKVTCGNHAVGSAMLRGGATALADSRLVNLAKLHAAGVPGPFWLLRAPTPAQADETVHLADVSLESELDIVLALDVAAAAQGRVHGVVCMVDVGDLREGVLPEDLLPFVERVAQLKNVRVAGVGVNLSCYGAIVPSEENLGELADLAAQAETMLGRPIVVSGGNSGSLDLALAGRLPAGVNSLRLGESLLLGLNTLTREPLPGLRQDAFLLRAPIIECLTKPSKPRGESAQDAFGNRPVYEDRGNRRRTILAIGRQDVYPDLLTPLDPRVEVLGASSDHLILDVEAVDPAPRVGDVVEFIPGYGSVLQLFTSPYIEKVFVAGEKSSTGGASG